MDNQNNLVIVRIFDAPRESVWKAWTIPELYMKWWGPEHFTSPKCTIDFKVGGKYFSCMEGPDHKRYYGTGKYTEITPMAKFVYTDSFADEYGNVVTAMYYGMPDTMPKEMLVTVQLDDENAKTKMTLTHAGMPPEMMDLCRMSWEQSFDKLANSLRQ